MVEQNDNNNQNTDDAAPKRRGRLFGGRRARSAGTLEARSGAQESAAVDETQRSDHGAVAETGTGSETAAVAGATDTSTASTASRPDAPAADAADAPAAAPAAPAADAAAAPAQDTPTTGSVSVEVQPVTATDAPEDVSTVTGSVPVIDAAAAATAEATAVEQSDATDAPGAAPQAQDAGSHDVEQQDATPEPVVPRATSTLSLIFHAPVLPELPARSSRNDRPDRADRFDRGDRAERIDRADRSERSDWDDDDEDFGGGSRRRTRRRGTSADREPRDHQEPRRREVELITEPQRIKGSTRLEAKKQRRRDGRDAGRRRQVVTEDEFLARRESVDRRMIVRSSAEKIEIGVIEDNVLAEHYVTKSHNVSLIGNVYLGKVQNVLPSMEAAFVDIGRGRNAVLYAGEVDWNSVETGNHGRRIEAALKPGDKVLVQVTKDPVGHKGARLTSQVSLPGRYLVYVPNGSMNGISRKLPDTERARLKKILKEVLPEHAGVIVRTAAEGATEEQLTRDVQRLTAQWEAIQKKVEHGHAPVMLHSEPDLLVKIVRDVFNEDFTKLIIDGDAARATIEQYLDAVAPDLKDRVELYDGPDSFEEHRLNEQIEKALDRKVWLPSGGSLVIDRTEAMTVVDVNTGKFVGSGGNLEETVTKNNLEAAEELVRQLRLRDIGGIIVVDFIDMVLETNRDLVLRRLVECLSRDRTKHQVAEVTSLGLVQMTRKKIGVGLRESLEEVNAKVNDNNADPGPSKGRRKGRSGSGGGNDSGQRAAEQKPAQAHQITDDVKHALSRIAASTIAHDEVVASNPATPASAPSDESTAPAGGSVPEAPESTGGPKRRRRRGGRASSEQSAPTTTDGILTVPAPDASGAPARDAAGAPASAAGSAPSTESAPASADRPVAAPEPAATPVAESAKVAPTRRRVSSSAPVTPADTTVAILDIPVAVTKREPRKAPDADSLLDSVLQALPEPKQPGQGRSRSRRVSSGSISAPATSDGGATDDGAVILGN